MSKKNREAFMTAKAKQLVLIYGPAYYREYKEPVIEETTSKEEREEDYGEKRYKVKFPYHPSKEKQEGIILGKPLILIIKLPYNLLSMSY